MNNLRLLCVVAIGIVTLSACAENSEVGGSAGDSPADPAAVERILPFAGLYTLPGNWAGLPVSTAFLEIQQPNAAGMANVLILRQNDTLNCIEASPSRGTAEKEPFSDDVFLNRIFELPDSVLTLSADTQTLTIALNEDVQDIDDDGDLKEPISIDAQRLGMLAIDLPGTCT